MKWHLALFATAAVLTTALLSGRAPQLAPRAPKVASQPGDPTHYMRRLPVAFVPNLGQWDHHARFVARIGPMTMFVEERGWSFTLVEEAKRSLQPTATTRDEPALGVAVRMKFMGARQADIVAERQLPGRHHYFLGNDRTKWRSAVPIFGSVLYRSIHEGVDVRLREHEGHFEYDLLVEPGADLEPVEIEVEGATMVRIDEDGALVMETGLGPVRMPCPTSWEEGTPGERQGIECRYELRGARRFGFVTAPRRAEWSLTIDPGLVWSTYLGGGLGDEVRGIAATVQGDLLLCGSTVSTTFPVTPGAFAINHHGGYFDAFVARLTNDGSSLQYSTFLGGVSGDAACCITVDSSGAAVVSGATDSPNFPTTLGAWDGTFAGGDAFVTRLATNGAALTYSTLLGGSSSDRVDAIDITAADEAVVAGHTQSTDFPTTNGCFQPSNLGNLDAFVTRLAANGSTLMASTLLGGSNDDRATAIDVDGQGNVTVGGTTLSSNFPVTQGALDPTHGGNFYDDGFVSRFTPQLGSLAFSTFLGGSNFENISGLLVEGSGATLVAGTTGSTNFPTTPGGLDPSFNGGGEDAFVARIGPSGSTLSLSTFLGGNGADGANGLALDALGRILVAGETSSTNFPTSSGTYDSTSNGGRDAFVLALSTTGSSLEYSTVVGGLDDDRAFCLASAADASIVVAGWTFSNNFPTTPSTLAPGFLGVNYDAFIARFDLLPTGVSMHGASSPGCNGPIVVGVRSQPRVGNTAFSLASGNAMPSSVGLVGFATAGLPAPLAVLGVDVWLDPSTLLATGTTISSASGTCDVPLPIQSDPALANLRLFAQFLWLGSSSPPPCPALGFSASPALDITIQP